MKKLALGLMTLCLCIQTQYAGTMYKIVRQETQKVPGELPQMQTPTGPVFKPTDLAKKKTLEGEPVKKEENVISLHDMCEGDVCVLEEHEEGVFKTEKFNENPKKQKKYVGTAQNDGGDKLGVFIKKKRKAPVKKAVTTFKEKRKQRKTKKKEIL